MHQTCTSFANDFNKIVLKLVDCLLYSKLISTRRLMCKLENFLIGGMEYYWTELGIMSNCN